MNQSIRLMLFAGAGAGLAGAGVLLGLLAAPAVPADAAATTTTLTETTLPTQPFVAPGETLLGNTALVPRSLVTEEGEVTLEYELVRLGPSLTTPETFELRTAGGDVRTEIVRNEERTSVSFDVAETDGVEAIVVTTTRTPTTMQYEVEIPHAETVALVDGSTVSVGTILEQSNGSIVRFEVEPPADVFGSQDAFFVESLATGAEPGWEGSATFAGPGAFGSPQLLWAGDGPVPDPLVLVVTTWTWLQQPTSLPIDLEAVR